jgi:hypothetical protein
MNLADIHHPFARTNAQTIRHRAVLLKELCPGISSLAEICCGDCQRQYDIYRSELGIQRFRGLDLSRDIVVLNRSRNVPCDLGNALDSRMMLAYLGYDIVFFGPPLSGDCDGHHLIAFRDVIPSFSDFARLMMQELNYRGILVLIGPRTTTLGDAQWIDHQIRSFCPDYGLRLLHYSHSTITGSGESTEMRLKYVELWYQFGTEHQWEVRESKG